MKQMGRFFLKAAFYTMHFICRGREKEFVLAETFYTRNIDELYPLLFDNQYIFI
jgi:hypothetical protein